MTASWSGVTPRTSTPVPVRHLLAVCALGASIWATLAGLAVAAFL